MRVLVTGGAGYIGSVVVRALGDAGFSVRVLDTLERGHRAAVPPTAEFRRGSVGDRDAVADALLDCDAVVHLAGYIDVAESQRRPELYMRNNFEEPRVLLDSMRAQGVRTLVFSSTAAVYGEPTAVPIPEDAATAPVSAYGQSKLAFEEELNKREVRDGLRAVSFRYFNVAGAAPDGSAGEAHSPETHIIPRILSSMRDGNGAFTIYGGDYPTRDGTCIRDYIHVFDLAMAHVAGLSYLLAGGPSCVMNLGNGAGFSNLEVLRCCESITGVPLSIEMAARRPGDPAVLVASSERAMRVLGWQPRYPDIASMVEHAWAWHVAHPRGYE